MSKCHVTVCDLVDRCVATTVTPALWPGTKYNTSQSIHVGACDHGPLQYDVISGSNGIQVGRLLPYSLVSTKIDL